MTIPQSRLLLYIALTVVATWVGLNAARAFYADWSFLHAARLYQESYRPAPPAAAK